MEVQPVSEIGEATMFEEIGDGSAARAAGSDTARVIYAPESGLPVDENARLVALLAAQDEAEKSRNLLEELTVNDESVAGNDSEWTDWPTDIEWESLWERHGHAGYPCEEGESGAQFPWDYSPKNFPGTKAKGAGPSNQ